jgi:hypothetical protein
MDRTTHPRILFAIAAAVLSAALLSGCVLNKLNTEPQTIELRDDISGRPVVITVTPGTEWSSRMQAGPFIVNVLPQFVIWTEDGAGEFLETLYVTGADYHKLRHAEKNESGEQFYLDTLPVWATRARAAGETLPSKDHPYPDTVTSATPMGQTTFETTVGQADGGVRILLEINKSGDVNAEFTKETNDPLGQPSLIYAVTIPRPVPGDEYTLEPAGHGGMISDVAEVYTDLSGFDTALAQIASVSVRFE